MALIVLDVFIDASGISSKSAHVADVRDRHADLADLAAGQRVVRVVAGLGREVEGDRRPGLPLLEVAPVEGVARGGALEWPAYVRMTQGRSRSGRAAVLSDMPETLAAPLRTG